jgi:hypothetical protein
MRRGIPPVEVLLFALAFKGEAERTNWEDRMTEQRKLEEAAAVVDDVGVTLDEVKEGVTCDGAAATTLEQAKDALSDAADAIEEGILHIRKEIERAAD